MTTTTVLSCALWIILPVAVPLCVFSTFWLFLGLSLTAAGKALGPWQAGAYDSRIPATGPDPAHRAYWSRQMWLDARSAAYGSMLAVRQRLETEWLHRIAKRLFHGQDVSTGLPGETRFTRSVRRLLAPGTVVGAVAGALLAALLTAVTLAVFALLLGLVWLLGVTAAGALRGAERGWRLARGIRMACPYPGCYRPFPLAVHRCPNCNAAHRALRPGRYGALWHVCACGQKLVTTSLTGRDRFAARCPHCDRHLPTAVGITRVVHLPLVGGTSAGKTMLLAAMAAGLQAWSRRSPLTVGYASPDDLKSAGSVNQQLNQTGWALKTQGGQPRALMLRVGYGRRRRLLYLYDPMGESLRDAGTVRMQQYLEHADGVILVADVLAEPCVRRALEGGDAERAGEARPADLGPLDTYQRLTGELSALTGRRRRIPMAAVVTKRDVLDRLSALPVPGARIDGWLTEIGLGALVRGLAHDFRTVRYWAISAYAATGAGALGSEQLRAAEPVLWVLARSGLRVGALAGGPPTDEVPGARAETVRGRASR
ncbi:hypothetical protein A6A06_20100 [Streptomyces sp. CB02923]|uniref:TRAFAC clade GTPase domain-containing protein n=1 Tax=Streptomyces sp. CB02923 TaxID=1718985 RepID=UPI00093A4173|nr:hypothetical protein [Streptomyces sp. CB02923]OKI01141.1 hypothetical protein A6A06_20100 [Streptomyces sp. CB02923]